MKKQKKQSEQALFYGFQDEAKLALAQQSLRHLQIPSRVIPQEQWYEKVGYLLGMPGFRATAQPEDDGFAFPHEVLILQGIRGKRLDTVLAQFQQDGVSHIPYKSVVTPFNTLWTLRRLCETMQKEHAYMAEQEAAKASANKEQND